MSASAQTILLLVLSNLFITVAWDGHLRSLAAESWQFSFQLF